MKNYSKCTKHFEIELSITPKFPFLLTFLHPLPADAIQFFRVGEHPWLCKNYYAPIARLIRASTLIILSHPTPCPDNSSALRYAIRGVIERSRRVTQKNSPYRAKLPLSSKKQPLSIQVALIERNNSPYPAPIERLDKGKVRLLFFSSVTRYLI
jgi:hypothetical protein